jgi:hypothetical protein
MTSSKATTGKPKSAKSGGASSLDRAQKIKLAVSVSVILLVTVFILIQQGIISFGSAEETFVSDISPEERQAALDAAEQAKMAPPPRPTDPVKVSGQ